MSDETSSPAPDTGPLPPQEVIAADIKAADAVITPLITAFNPAIGTAIHGGLKLLAIAEPAVYAAAVAVLQGKPLTPEQDADLKAAESRLQKPEDYFA